MFNNKFFRISPWFEALARSEEKNEVTRFQRFFATIHEMLVMFETDDTVSAVKILAVATIAHEKIPFSVRIQHHFKISVVHSDGRTRLLEDPFELQLPYEELGNGAFELQRDSEDVKAFLALIASDADEDDLEIEYRALVAKISYKMDAGFEPCSIAHDVGLQKI